MVNEERIKMDRNLPFKERSAWINASIMLLLAGYYYVKAFSGEPPGPAATLGLLFQVVVFIVVLEIVGHIAITLWDRRTDTDERDKLIEARAGNIAGYVLGFSVVTTIGYALLFSAIDPKTQMCNPTSIASAAHLLVLGMLFSELTKAGAQLVFYRRGV
jgi:hypothetical protein